MLKVLERKEWVAKIEDQRQLYFNEQYEVVEALKFQCSCEARYFIFEKKGTVVISLIAMVKGNRIFSPIHFFYSALWIKPTLGDTRYCEYVAEFLRMLQRSFVKIDMRLPSSITDIRPFLWVGFSISNRFTYLKNLDKLEYSNDVKKNIEKSAQIPYTFKAELLTQEILQLNLQIFSELKLYSKKSIAEIGQLISELGRTKYLTCFSCYLRGELLVSHIIFLDDKNKTAYTVLKNKLYQPQPGSIHSALYHHLFVFLKSKGIEYVDLLGADMESISAFKSRFKVNLASVDVVSYSYINSYLLILKRKIIYTIKRIKAMANI